MIQRFSFGQKLYIPFLGENDAYEVEYICEENGFSKVLTDCGIESHTIAKLCRTRESAIEFGYRLRHYKILALEKELTILKELNKDYTFNNSEEND